MQYLCISLLVIRYSYYMEVGYVVIAGKDEKKETKNNVGGRGLMVQIYKYYFLVLNLGRTLSWADPLVLDILSTTCSDLHVPTTFLPLVGRSVGMYTLVTRREGPSTTVARYYLWTALHNLKLRMVAAGDARD